MPDMPATFHFFTSSFFEFLGLALDNDLIISIFPTENKPFISNKFNLLSFRRRTLISTKPARQFLEQRIPIPGQLSVDGSGRRGRVAHGRSGFFIIASGRPRGLGWSRARRPLFGGRRGRRSRPLRQSGFALRGGFQRPLAELRHGLLRRRPRPPRRHVHLCGPPQPAVLIALSPIHRQAGSRRRGRRRLGQVRLRGRRLGVGGRGGRWTSRRGHVVGGIRVVALSLRRNDWYDIILPSICNLAFYFQAQFHFHALQRRFNTQLRAKRDHFFPPFFLPIQLFRSNSSLRPITSLPSILFSISFFFTKPVYS